MPLGKDISVEARDESSRTLTLTAATVLIAEVGIQGCLAPDHLREVPYMGLSFIAVGPLLTVVPIGVLTAPRGLDLANRDCGLRGDGSGLHSQPHCRATRPT